MEDLIEITINILKQYKVGIDERGIVSFPNRVKYPIKLHEMADVYEWIKNKHDFGESRSSYGIINEMKYSFLSISNGAFIATAIGLKNEFLLNRLNLEVSFPNRLLIHPETLNKNPSVKNVINQTIYQCLEIRKMSQTELEEMVSQIKQEWKTKKFGFFGNLSSILNPSALLYGIFKEKVELIGFIVFTLETDLSPAYFEIFPKFRRNNYASQCIRFIQKEMSGNISTIEFIPESKSFWEKMGYKKIDKFESYWMSMIC